MYHKQPTFLVIALGLLAISPPANGGLFDVDLPG